MIVNTILCIQMNTTLIDHVIILHRPWRTITACARDCVSIPPIIMQTLNSIFKENVNYKAHSKTKCKRKECLTKPSTWTLGIKKVLTDSTRLAWSLEAELLGKPNARYSTTIHSTLQCTLLSRQSTLFVTLKINLIISFSSAFLHLGIWCPDFHSNGFARNVNTCLGGL